MLYCRAAPALDSCRLPLSGEYFPLKRMSAPAPFAQEHFGYCLWSALACASAKCILRRMQFHISTPTITIKISAAQEPIQRQPSEFSHHLRRSLRDSEWNKKQNTFFILLSFCYQFSLFDFFFLSPFVASYANFNVFCNRESRVLYTYVNRDTTREMIISNNQTENVSVFTCGCGYYMRCGAHKWNHLRHTHT